MIGVYAWLVAALFFLILEMGHPGLFYWTSFSLGSLVAATLSWCDYSWQSAGIGFLVSSLLAIVLLKFSVGKLIKKHSGAHTLTNTDALIGKIGRVVEPISVDKAGRVKIGGEEWLARAYKEGVVHESASHESASHEGALPRSTHQTLFEVGVRVSVVAVRGSHLVVTLVNE